MANLQVVVDLLATNNASPAISAVESEIGRLTSATGASATAFGQHTAATQHSGTALTDQATRAAASSAEMSRMTASGAAAAGVMTEHATATSASGARLTEHATAAQTSGAALDQHATNAQRSGSALGQHASAAEASGGALTRHASASSSAAQSMGHMNTVAESSVGVFGRLKEMAINGFGLVIGYQALQQVGSAFESIVPAAAHFETTMNELKQNTGLTAEEMDVMKQGVIDLSRESGVGTDLIAGGWQRVMNVTQSAADATGITEIAMKSAVSTGGDVAKTSDVLARAMHEYGLDTSHAADETDRHNEVLRNANSVMAAFHVAAQLSDETLQEFSDNSSRAVGFGSQLGVSLIDVTAAMSTLAKHGFDAAGSQVQIVDSMQKMINPTKAAETELKKLSAATGVDLVHAFTSAGLHQNGYIGNLELLHTALTSTKADQYEQAAVLVNLGLASADTAARIQGLGLANADVTGETLRLIQAQRGGIGTAAELTVGWDDLHTSAQKIGEAYAAGTVTEEAWNDTMLTTDRRWAILTNDLKLGALTIGGQLLPSINGIVSALSDKLPAAASLVQASWIALTSDAGAMGLVLDNVRKLFGDAVADGFQPFAQQIMDNLPTIRVEFQKFADEATPAVQDVVKQVGDLAPQVLKTGGDIAIGIGQGVEALNTFQAASATSSVGIHNDIVKVATDFDQQTSGINAAVDEQVTKITGGWSLMGSAADEGGRTSVVSVMRSFDQQTTGINTAVDEQVSRTQTGWDLQVAATGTAMSNLGDLVHTGWDTSVASTGAAFDAMGSGVRAGMDAVGSTVGSGFDAVGTTIHGALDATKGAIDATWNAIPEDIRSDLGLVGGLIEQRFGEQVARVGDGMSQIGTTVNDGWTSVTSAVGSSMSAVGSAVHAGWDAVSTTVGTVMSAVGTAVKTGWDAITTAVGTAMSEIGTKARVGWDAVSTAVSGALATALTTVTTWISDVLGKITGMAPDMGKAGSAAGQSAVDGITSALTGGLDAVGKAAGNLARWALNQAKNALGAPPTSPWPAWVELGSFIPAGLVAGIDGGTAAVGASARALAAGTDSAFADEIDAHSRSRKFLDHGANIAQSVADGIHSRNPEVRAAARELARQAQIGVQEALPVGDFLVAGENMGDGIALGLLRGVDKAKTAADTYGNSIIGEMHTFTRNVETEIENTTNKLADIQATAERTISSALDAETTAIDAASARAEDAIAKLNNTFSLNAVIAARKSDLQAIVSDEERAHAVIAAATEAEYQHRLALSKAEITFHQQMEDAKTTAQKLAVEGRYKDTVTNINQSYKDSQVAVAHRQELDAKERLFKVGEDAKIKGLNDQLAQEALATQIRDIEKVKTTSITNSQETYVDAVAKANLTADTTRLTLLRSYGQRIDDLKTAFLDKIPPLEGPALEAFDAFMANITGKTDAMGLAVAGSLSSATKAITTSLALDDLAVEHFADVNKISWDEARAQMMAGAATAHDQLAVAIPASFNVTDRALDEAAAKATEVMGDGGVLPDAVSVTDRMLDEMASKAKKNMGDGGVLPTAASQSGAAFIATGQTADKVIRPALDQLQDAAKKLASDGMDRAKDATTQIAAVLLQLRDGINGEGAYSGRGLTKAVDEFTSALEHIPRHVDIYVTTHYSSTGTPGGGGGGGGKPNADGKPDTQHPGESGPGGIWNDPSTGRPYTHASGGVTTGPISGTFGENGPEAIIPLQDYTFAHKSEGQAAGRLTREDARMLAEELAHVLQNVQLSVGVEAIHSALLQKAKRGMPLGLA